MLLIRRTEVKKHLSYTINSQDIGRANGYEGSNSRNNSNEPKSHNRGLSWELKRQAREQKVKQMEENLNQIKNQATKRTENPYYDNSFRSNIKISESREQYIQNSQTKTTAAHDTSYDMRRSRDAATSPFDPQPKTVVNDNQQFQNTFGSPSYRPVPPYSEYSPKQGRKNNYSNQDSNSHKTLSLVDRSYDSNQRSRDMPTAFKQDFENIDRNKPNPWDFDNNVRGKRLKEEYNKYVSEEMEKERNVNPRSKRIVKDRSFTDDIGSNTGRRLEGIPNYQAYNSPGMYQSKSQPRDSYASYDQSRQLTKQEAHANDLLEQAKS